MVRAWCNARLVIDAVRFLARHRRLAPPPAPAWSVVVLIVVVVVSGLVAWAGRPGGVS